MGRWTKIIGGAAILLAIAFAIGPRPSMDVEARFDPDLLPSDLDAYLMERESAFDDITPGAEKEILWFGEAGARTPLSIVYLHGFSATKAEIRPVPDRIAAALGANLYYARLPGHGRPGAALGAAKADDWYVDTLEALEIGRRIGERVVVIGTSTGVTLAAAALAAGAPDVAGLIGVSPNFAVKGAPTPLMTMPFGDVILPLLLGAERSWEPLNEGQATWWTTSYPLTAITQLGAAVDAAGRADLESVSSPALFIFSDDDEVVDHEATRKAAARWGGPIEIVDIAPGAGDSPSRHVIAGDILSPGGTEKTIEAALSWLRSAKIAE